MDFVSKTRNCVSKMRNCVFKMMNSADVRLQEPSCLDGGHGPETVNYLAMESGSWTGDEGTMVQAGVNEIEGDMRLTGQQFQIVQGC